MSSFYLPTYISWLACFLSLLNLSYLNNNGIRMQIKKKVLNNIEIHVIQHVFLKENTYFTSFLTYKGINILYYG